MQQMSYTVSEEDLHSFLTSCIITCAGLGWRGFYTYQLDDPGLVNFNNEENHLYILNWIALCFASHPSTHAAVSLSSEKGHFTLHVATKGGESYLRDTVGDNEFARMTQELLERQATRSVQTSADMFQDRELAEGYLIRWCWPAFWGKVKAVQETLRELDHKKGGAIGSLDELIDRWSEYRKEVPFDQASIVDLMRSRYEAPRHHPTLTAEAFRSFIHDIRSRTEPVTTKTKAAATLAKERHDIYYTIMTACLALDRCDFIRASIDGGVVQDETWRKLIGEETHLRMEDLFHQVQRLLEYHLGLITYLGHGLPYFRTALTANNGDLKKAFSIHHIPLLISPAIPISVMLNEEPKVWIPKLFTDNKIEKSNLKLTGEEVGKLVQACRHFWKAGDVIPLTTHTLCDMVHYLTHEGKNFECEAIGTSDIPCLMCDRYVSGLRTPRKPSKVDLLRYRRPMTSLPQMWTPPLHTTEQMKRLISTTLGQFNSSVRYYFQKNRLRNLETNESVLKSFGLTNDDLDSM